MRRLVGTLTLILCLSFPALAGHVLGDGRYCECNNPNAPHAMSVQSGNCEITIEDNHQKTAPDTEPDLLLLLMLILEARA